MDHGLDSWSGLWTGICTDALASFPGFEEEEPGNEAIDAQLHVDYFLL